MLVEQMTRNETANAIDTCSSEPFFTQIPNLEVKVTQNASELNQAKKLRLRDHSIEQDRSKSKKAIQNNTLYSKQLIEQQHILIHDGYDSYADHMIVIDHDHNKIVAYVRLIDAYTAYKIGGYYCETRFNLNKLFNSQTFYLEMSRLVIDPDYYNSETASLLWAGIIKHAQEKGIDSIIGSLSLPLNHSNNVYAYISQLKRYAMSDSQCRVQPYQLLPDQSAAMPLDNEMNHPVFNYFFEQGVKLCGDAYWNKEYNSAELFIHYPINQASVFPECIRMNEIQLGLMYE